MEDKTLTQINTQARRRRTIIYWLKWLSWVVAGITIIVAVLDATGVLHDSWNKWITFAIAILAFIALWPGGKPEKAPIDKELNSMRPKK